MRYNHVLRAGTAGAIGFSLFLGAGSQATASPRPMAKPVSARDAKGRPGDGATATHGYQNAQALGLASPQITRWHQVEVKSGDSLSQVFSRVGLGARDWTALLKLNQPKTALRQLRPGDQLDIRKTPDGRLAELRYRMDRLRTLIVNRDSNGLHAHIAKKPTETRELTASGTVGASLSKSLAEAGVPARVAYQLADIYKYRANLSRQMHPGDRFSLVYRATYTGSTRISTGPIIAASITTGGHTIRAFLADDGHGHSDYYDATGHSFKPSFSRHPVAYTRVSSPFNLHRMNPVLHVVRPHYGVDLAAPLGTPVHAAANGVVKFVGWQHGYGRIVELQHFEGYSTRYAHMHGFAHHLHDGEHVTKGQVIGYVGESGEATGPHLHFEIRKHGVAHNPLTMKLPTGEPLPHSQMAQFTRHIQPLLAKLDHVPSTLLASTAGHAGSHSCTRSVTFNARLALDPVGAARRHSLDHIFCVVHAPATNA